VTETSNKISNIEVASNFIKPFEDIDNNLTLLEEIIKNLKFFDKETNE
jgi:hypothetical protein